ncbi:MAG TPA: 2'-5' RNA ligase family protein [Methanoregulaceae archaeon]|nr:2'-5' RNA ligase family protein [Methanoregulaceae archaeon]
MTVSRRQHHFRTWQNRRARGSDEYFLMIRVNDWKLSKKTEFISHLVPDQYLFPPFQHVTLYGPFFLREGLHPGVLCQAIESACRKCPGFILELSGWIRLRGRRGLAIAHDIEVSSAFREFYDVLWHSIAPLTESLSWIDRDPLQRLFHITHSYNMRTRDAESVCERIRRMIEMGAVTTAGSTEKGENRADGNHEVFMPEYAPLTVFRIALLKNGSVRAEFDMPSGDWLTRPLAYRHERAVISLKQYRHISGIELVGPPKSPKAPPFVVSDLHLGHENIIKYCRRPFSSAAEMDEVLINNWNRVVGSNDEVLFLGDLRYGPTAAPPAEYLGKLAGRITYIRGNHDEDTPGQVSSVEKKTGGLDLLFIHDPAGAPPDYDGWIIHGHAHNNNIREYPFIDFIHRRVNVSIEMTGYRPVSLSTILGYIARKGQRARIDLLPSTTNEM